MDIRESVIHILKDNFDLPELGEEQYASFNLMESGVLDSFGIVKFVVQLEETFGIALTDQDLESNEFQTIDGVAKLIHHKLNL